MTSSPPRRSSSFRRSTSANAYGGRASTRRKSMRCILQGTSSRGRCVFRYGLKRGRRSGTLRRQAINNALRRSGVTVHANGSAEHVSFSDVARAHHKWDSADGDGGAARDEYEATLAAFEKESRSRVVEAYWCRQQASAVALAKLDGEAPGRLTRMLRREDVPDFRLYRETD